MTRRWFDALVTAMEKPPVAYLHHESAISPPTLVFLGTKEQLVPVATVREFESWMKSSGDRCAVKIIEGGIHPLLFLSGGSVSLAWVTSQGL